MLFSNNLFSLGSNYWRFILKILLTLILFVFLISCGAPKSVFLTKNYTDKKFSDKKISVFVDTVNMIINNHDDVLDDLVDKGEKKSDANSIFFEFFNSEIKAKPNSFSLFQMLNTNNMDVVNRLKKQSYNFADNKTYSIKTPIKDSSIKFSSNETRFILFIQDIDVFRSVGRPGTSTVGANGMMTTTGGTSSSLRIACYFILWDNKEMDVVSYGKAIGSSSFLFAMGKDNWEQSIKFLMKDIFSQSPFKR